MVKLTGNARRMIEGKNFAHIATLMRDGSPQVSAVWIDHQGDYILVNTAIGRTKQRNTKRDPRVALSIYDQDDPYEETLIRGKVVQQITVGAWEHIDKLSRKYTGKDYPRKPGEKRVVLKIRPDRIASWK